MQELRYALAAAQPLIRLDTVEPMEAVELVASQMKAVKGLLLVWDAARGVVASVPDLEPQQLNVTNAKGQSLPTGDGLAVLGWFNSLKAADVVNALTAGAEQYKEDVAAGKLRLVLCCLNMHLLMERRASFSPLIQHIASDGKANRRNVVAIMPATAQLPDEVSSLFQRILFDLPDAAELSRIFGTVRIGNALSAETLAKCGTFATGLTRQQAENAFTLCRMKLIKEQKDEAAELPKAVWDYKADIINEGKMVELYRGRETFKAIGGLGGLKDFLKSVLESDAEETDPECRARGVALIGVSGGGKTAVAKAVGNELGLPVVNVKMGSLFGSLVGQTEANTSSMFAVLRKVSPCIAILDEADKTVPQGGDSGDSGVSNRMLGEFLTQMNDMQERVFWVITGNSAVKIPTAFLRAERVDATFYVGLPSPAQKAEVWRIYVDKILKGRVVPGDEGLLAQLSDPDRGDLPTDAQWTPAEIKTCCRLSRLQRKPVSEVAKQIRPVAQINVQEFEETKDWASKSAICAETGLPYGSNARTSPLAKPRKKGREADTLN